MSSSPTSSPSPRSNRDTSPTKLDPTSLGEHTKRFQGNHSPDVSKKLFVDSWVASQAVGLDLSTEIANVNFKVKETDSTPVNIPVIIITDADEDMANDNPEVKETDGAPVNIPVIIITDADEEMNADPLKPDVSYEHKSKPQPVNRGSPEIKTSTTGSYQKSSLTSHKIPRVRVLTDQPVIEEPEDAESENVEPVTDKLRKFKNAVIRLTTSYGAQDSGSTNRQRARSYPCPPNQLPRSKIEYRKESSIDKATEKKMDPKMSKFAQVAIMAKKWKKKTNCTTENTKESTVARQRTRPFIEVPRALKLEVLEDAYPIVQKACQMYKSSLGPKHQLTILADRHLEKLNIQLGK